MSRTPETSGTARAWAYLRVSSDGQVRTDYSDDGLSINAQREAARDKASQLNSNLVKEFKDPGKSAYVDLHKRVGFLEMLEALKRCNSDPATHIDYVIVWSLSRWARNSVDHGRRATSSARPALGWSRSPSPWLARTRRQRSSTRA